MIGKCEKRYRIRYKQPVMQEEISFGVWLRKKRRGLDLSRQAFANQVGCAEVTLRQIEEGTLQPSNAHLPWGSVSPRSAGSGRETSAEQEICSPLDPPQKHILAVEKCYNILAGIRFETGNRFATFDSYNDISSCAKIQAKEGFILAVWG